MKTASKLSITVFGLLASLGVQAQVSTAQKLTPFDVELRWLPMPNSYSDAVIDQSVVAKIIEDELVRMKIRPTFVQKSSGYASIRIRLNYLYIASTGTRVLTGVAGVMTKDMGETCSVDLATWSRSNSGQKTDEMKAVVKSWIPRLNMQCHIL